MGDFFSTTPNPVMQLYSLQHLIPVLLCIVLVVLVFKYRVQIRNLKNEKYIRYTFIAILILSEISIALWRGLTGTYNITHTLPLHLCSFSALMIEIVMITKSRKIMDYIYYISIGGAFIAMVYPDLRFSFTQFRYLEFFIFHIVIVVSIFYMVFVHRLIPSKSALWKSFISVHVLAIPIVIFNSIVGGSYWMLVHTSVPLLKQLFGPWPQYIIGLEILLFVLFGINYVITYFVVYRRKDQI